MDYCFLFFLNVLNQSMKYSQETMFLEFITIKLSKGEIMIMKHHTKRKLSELTEQQLKKKYNYMKSKQSPKAKAKGDSIQMKYIKFHIKKKS